MSILNNARFRTTGQQIVDNIVAVRERGEAIDNEMLERAIDWMTVAITSASANDPDHKHLSTLPSQRRRLPYERVSPPPPTALDALRDETTQAREELEHRESLTRLNTVTYRNAIEARIKRVEDLVEEGRQKT